MYVEIFPWKRELCFPSAKHWIHFSEKLDIKGFCVGFNLLIKVGVFFRQIALQKSLTTMLTTFPLTAAGIWTPRYAPVS